MIKYRVFETARFSKDLNQISKDRARQLELKLKTFVYPQLIKEPHFGPNIKRLRNYDPATFRYRIGDWRFFYIIDEEKKVIVFVAASHRKNAYRK